MALSSSANECTTTRKDTFLSVEVIGSDDETDTYSVGDNPDNKHNRKLKWYWSPIAVSMVLTFFGMYVCSEIIFQIHDATRTTARENARASTIITGTLSSLWSDVTSARSMSILTKGDVHGNSPQPGIEGVSSGSRSSQQHFVPTMSFQYTAKFPYDDKYSEDKYCDKPRDLSWEWNWNSGISAAEYNNTILPNETSTTFIPGTTHNYRKKRVLIGMYVGYDQYAKLMYHTAYVNKAYAKHWNYDLVILQGTALSVCRQDDYEGRRVTLNKIRLLFHAIDHKHIYDQLLLLDSDAMMYNFTVDVSTLLDDDHMVAGHYVEQKDFVTTDGDDGPNQILKQPTPTWDINAGILLWNLHHNLTRRIAVEWYVNARDAVLKQSFKGDQVYLHRTLKLSPERIQNSIGLPSEFAYGHGTVIRHYIRRLEFKDWRDPRILDDRMDRITEDANEVCQIYSPACDVVERVSYPTE